MRTKTICVSLQFHAPIDEVWDKLQRLDTLQYIAAPYVTFKPIDNTGTLWEEGKISKF